MTEKTRELRSDANSEPGLRLLALCALTAAIGIVGVSIQFAARAARMRLDLTANSGVGQVLLYALVLTSIGLFARYQMHEPLGGLLARYWTAKPRVVRGFLLTASPTLAALLGLAALLTATGDFEPSADARQHLTGALLGQTAIALIVVIVLAATEEFIFRGFAFRYLRGLKPRASLKMPVAASALLFALAHNFHTLPRWLERQNVGLLIGLWLLGILLAVVYQASGSLACSVGVHSALVWLGVFRSRTHLLTLHQYHWWMGVHDDLRTAPVVWLLFVALTAVFWANRTRLRWWAEIEGSANDYAQER